MAVPTRHTHDALLPSADGAWPGAMHALDCMDPFFRSLLSHTHVTSLLWIGKRRLVTRQEKRKVKKLTILWPLAIVHFPLVHWTDSSSTSPSASVSSSSCMLIGASATMDLDVSCTSVLVCSLAWCWTSSLKAQICMAKHSYASSALHLSVFSSGKIGSDRL